MPPTSRQQQEKKNRTATEKESKKWIHNGAHMKQAHSPKSNFATIFAPVQTAGGDGGLFTSP